MATISQELARFAYGLNFKAIPKEVVEKIKIHLLDILGICFVSSKMEFSDVANMGRDFLSTCLLLVAPVVVVSLLVGLIISIVFQLIMIVILFQAFPVSR